MVTLSVAKKDVFFFFLIMFFNVCFIFFSYYLARVQHHRIWTKVIRKHMCDLRTLPFDAIMNEFSLKLPNFTETYSVDFESERRERGETRAIDWLFGILLRTESE